MTPHIAAPVDKQKNRTWHLEADRIYFSRTAERKFFFVLTIIMLVLGACYKLGVLP